MRGRDVSKVTHLYIQSTDQARGITLTVIACQRRSGFRRVLSLWRRASSTDWQTRNENEERIARRTYSSDVLAGQKWRKKLRMGPLEQMGHSTVELIALEPAGAQLKPIHEVSRSNVCCTES